MDSKGKMGHRSARTKAAREEGEKLKEAEMEVDGEMPQQEKVEIQSPKKVNSGRIRRDARPRACDTATQPGRSRGIWASCQALSANHEDPFVGAIDAVKKPLGTGR